MSNKLDLFDIQRFDFSFRFFFLIPSIHERSATRRTVSTEAGPKPSGPAPEGGGPCSLFPRQTSPRCESQIIKQRRLHKIKPTSVRASLIPNHHKSRQKELTHRKRPGYKGATLVGGKKANKHIQLLKWDKVSLKWTKLALKIHFALDLMTRN